MTEDSFKFWVSELKVPPHKRSTHSSGAEGIRPRFMAHGIDSQSVKQDVPVIDAICVFCVLPVNVNALLRIIWPAAPVAVDGIIIPRAANESRDEILMRWTDGYDTDKIQIGWSNTVVNI